jgi:hypothetical protein
MKRITLTLGVAAALVIPALLFTGSAGASVANHGDKSNGNASCGGGSGGPPCNDPNLPQSDGCLHGAAPQQNPHCQPAQTPAGITPVTPASTPVPVASPPPAKQPANGVAGAEAGKKHANPGTAAAVSGNQIQELPFTGLSTLWLALIGAGMLALGLVLRARSVSPTAVTDRATEQSTAGGETRTWDVPELDIAPAARNRGVALPFSEFEALGRLLIGNGDARLRAGPGGTLLVAWDTG